MPLCSICRAVGPGVLLALLPGLAFAQPATAAGRVKVSSGTVAIVRNGQALPAPLGAEVFEGDVLRSGSDGRLAVMLRDETRVSIGPDSEVALAAFAFSPSESQPRRHDSPGPRRHLLRLRAGRQAGAGVSDHPDADLDHRRARHPRAGAGGDAVTRRLHLVLIVLTAVAGCARARPEVPGLREIVALAPEPESGDIGALTVRTPAGQAVLDRPYQATTLVRGQAPRAPTVPLVRRGPAPVR